MNKLRELTSSIDCNASIYNAKGHRKIYDHLHAILSESPDTSFTPPPSLVFYAARNILAPYFIIGQVPDLLNLLTAIETFRRFAVLKSGEALEWQKYYEREKSHGREEDVRLLTENEVRALSRFLERSDTQRWEYIVLVRSLIQLYIHYLWTAPESCLLPKRLNDFFPGSMQGTSKPSTLHFHIDLSEDEKVYFGQLKVECQEWMNLVVNWEKQREETCRDEGLSQEDMEANFADDFCATFSQPFEPSEMVRNVEIYMSKVEDIIRKLELWFPPPKD